MLFPLKLSQQIRFILVGRKPSLDLLSILLNTCPLRDEFQKDDINFMFEVEVLLI